MNTIKEMGHEQVLYCNDASSGLKAIIAIHDTTLGPALGGCRFWNYSSDDDALVDVLRLSRGMTYKAAVAGLNLGGGKSVIIGSPEKLKSPALLRSFGRFVNSLSGRYITAEDVNIKVQDINLVAEETKYVAGTTNHSGGSGDPSPVTAMGVFSGIKAAVKYKLKTSDLKGLTIGVQGLGAVGGHLCDFLADAGAKLIIADINQESVEKIKNRHGAKISTPDTIHQEQLDVFAPCALGGILNQKTIPHIKAKIVAGAANNQLLDEQIDGKALLDRDILYAPDYVINAGGLINVCHELKGYNQEAAKKDALGIYDTLLKIFALAEKNGSTTILASNAIAEERLRQHKKNDTFLKNSFDNQNWISKRH